MAIAVVPVNSGAQSGGFTQPNYCSFCVSNSGGSAGGLLANGLGVTSSSVATAFDLKTLFTASGFVFRSYPVLRAFQPVASAVDAFNQFLQYLEINAFLISSVGGTAAIGINYLWQLGGGPDKVPYLQISVPDANAIWRIDLKLRHSITN